jgi:ribose transport system permease protein
VRTDPARAAEEAPAAGADQAEAGRAALLRRLRGVPPIWLVLVALLALIVARQPSFTDPPVLLAFLKRSAPLMILAAGQLFVIVAGEFDLSVGSLITAVVVVAAQLSNGDPANTWWVIALLFGLGAVVGLVNGLVTTRLRVPSFIATLGMLFVLNGAVFLWSGGSPKGSLADNFRRWGRLGFTGIPWIGQLPYSVVILAVVGTGAVLLLHRTRFGQQVFAAGGNQRAAALSGVDVPNVRVAAFLLSATSAVIAGILLGGFSGVSAEVGLGYEFQAIAAVVLGGAALGGGRGSAGAALGGALTLQALFTLLNLLGLPKPLRDTVQGLIIIGAAAFASYRLRRVR